MLFFKIIYVLYFSWCCSFESRNFGHWNFGLQDFSELWSPTFRNFGHWRNFGIKKNPNRNQQPLGLGPYVSLFILNRLAFQWRKFRTPIIFDLFNPIDQKYKMPPLESVSLFRKVWFFISFRFSYLILFAFSYFLFRSLI